MKNADYDVKEKSEIEIPASFEGSGVADDESDESAGLPVVDENYDPSEGSAEFWTGAYLLRERAVVSKLLVDSSWQSSSKFFKLKKVAFPFKILPKILTFVASF